MIMPTPNASGT